jgi:hypothetical protein
MGNLVRFVGQAFNAHSWKWLIFGVVLTAIHLLLAVPILNLLVLWAVLPWMNMGSATFLHGTDLDRKPNDPVLSIDSPGRVPRIADFFAGIHRAPRLIGLATVNGTVLLVLLVVQMALYLNDPAFVDAATELAGMQNEYMDLSPEKQMQVMEELGLLDRIMAHLYETLALLLLALVWMGMAFTAPYRIVLEGKGIREALALSIRDGLSHWWLPLVVLAQAFFVFWGMASGFLLLPVLLPLALLTGFGVYTQISNPPKQNTLSEF